MDRTKEHTAETPAPQHTARNSSRSADNDRVATASGGHENGPRHPILTVELSSIVARYPRSGHALVSLLVSFSYVRPGSPGHSRPCRRRSRTATTHREHGPTDLESVLATSLRRPINTVELSSCQGQTDLPCSSEVQHPDRLTSDLAPSATPANEDR